MAIIEKEVLKLLFLLISEKYAYGFKTSLRIPQIGAISRGVGLQESFSSASSINQSKSLNEESSITKAPLVDSSLLRFLSEQRNLTRVQKPNITKDTTCSDIAGGSEKVGAVTEYSPNESENMTIKTTSRFEKSSNIDMEFTESYGSFASQYSAENIAGRLLTMGVDQECAHNAGNRVQSHALARITRQRIRKYLHNRDALWASGSEQTELLDKPDIPEKAKNEFSCDVENVFTYLSDSGLSGNDIAAIFTHTPSVAMTTTNSNALSPENLNKSSRETLEDIFTKTYFGLLCQTLKLRKYDARKVLRTCPGLLTKRGSKSADEVVSMLIHVGVQPNSLQRDKASIPILLSRSPSSLFRLITFLTSDDVRMPFHNIGPFIRRNSCSEFLDSVAPIPKLKSEIPSISIDEIEGKHLNMQSLDYLLNQYHEVAEEETRNRYKEMSKTAIMLRTDIGLQNLGGILSAYPNILLLNTECQISPVKNFLSVEIGIKETDICKVLENFPYLLGEDINKMKNIKEHLVGLGVGQDDLGIIIRSFPSLLKLDIENDITPVVQFLLSIGITDLSRFITRLPPILGYSVKNELKPKWKYLQSVCKYPKFELSRFPAYFSYPLQRVIMNRYEYLLDVKRLPATLFSVDEILRYGDKDFAMKIAEDKDDGLNYSQYVAKKSSMKRIKSTKRRTRNYTKPASLRNLGTDRNR
mmetsp:Transcript_9448/g.13399  ORF Transcript_9448/g.13399 Transcript_9448/m.13399 type:complete len:698 (-) Transcript_9448:392-2485(-)